MVAKETTHIRVWLETKKRIVALQRKLTIKNNGQPVTVMETLDHLLTAYNKKNSR